ncbi:flagellar basal body P-ring formation chaperone FlgA [Acetobacteraceae bacterium ESL0709]|nr:flagellar basal body P-ring formation chaperone FlgA [Acetobacteraceae bacterium ESL0697]MDF7679052.1 flagellar basal body P-ring formation chaperone FlgA [Acetobacteraceae bacterium ESL0709]
MPVLRLKGALFFLIVFAITIFSLGSCFAATLRNSVEVLGDRVSLSDLFDGLEPGQDRVIGPAPAPGKSIQIGGYQLIAIADQYGIEWEDQSSTASLTLKRAGHVLGRDYFADLVRKSISLDREQGGFFVDIDSFKPVVTDVREENPVTLSDINWDKKTGKFSATAYLSHPTGDKMIDSFALRGTIKVRQPVIVYNASHQAGYIMQGNDMHVEPDYSGKMPLSSQALPDQDNIIGMSLSHAVVAGEPVLATDLRRVTLVHQGDPVLITYDSPGIRLTATGRALEDGGSGQFIHALNLGSKMIVQGKVLSSGEVRVDASSTAIPAKSKEAKQFRLPALQ